MNHRRGLKPVTALPPPLQPNRKSGITGTIDRRLHASTTMLGHVETQQNNTTYRNPRSDNKITRVGDDPPKGMVQAYSHEERHLHPNPFGWQEWWEATRQARPMASDDDFIPATPTAQETTISHSRPTIFIESSHTKQGHCMPAGVCWKKLLRGAGVLAS
jgi:hypothetical protein